jgi:hypothetical protein
MRNDKTDADCLRDAAWILHTRAKRQTFALRVIIRVLQLRADRIELGRQPDAAVIRRHVTPGS